MPDVTYNRVTAQSVERLAALSDGIFAVAMTLLVLDLHGPTKEAVHSEQDLLHALGSMTPQIIAYLMSFLTLSIFWAGQQAQLNRFERSDRQLSWIHLLFLFAVSFLPFSTRLLAEFITFRTPLLIYWVNLLSLGAVLYLSWWHAKRNKLLRDETTPEVSKAIERRILVAQLLYAIGAALCLVSTYLSIAAIVLVQLNFAVAPRIRWLSKF